MNVNIRTATSTDVPQLCKLYYDFHEFHAAEVPERLKGLGPWEEFDTTQLSSDLLGIINNPQARLFVADNDRILAGLAEIYLREDEPDPVKVSYIYGHLQSLWLAPDWRKQGLGKKLLDAAETWAAEMGASEMRLDTWEYPGDPVKFYEQTGYRTIRRTLLRQL
jgi:GNAT superfamily N-acetyltransferase